MISEKDIFNYVFFKRRLSNDKVLEIEREEFLKEPVKFYTSIKTMIKSEIPFETKKKISSKISSYKLSTSFLLYPVNDEIIVKKNTARFAAASAKKDENIIVKTFLDEEKKYLIRFVRMNSESKIYIFSTTDEKIEDFEVIVHPLEKVFQMKNNSKPLIFESEEIPESVEIKFH